MIVSELINNLEKMNKNAQVKVCIYGQTEDLEVNYSGSEGCEMSTCDTVILEALGNRDLSEKEG